MRRRIIGHGLTLAAVFGLLSAFGASVHAAPTGKVKIRVKKGDLVITGSRGFIGKLEIVPTAGGLRVQEAEGSEVVINGSRAPFESSTVTRDWKFRFNRSQNGGIVATSPDDGVPALQPRNIAYTSGLVGVFELHGAEVQGNVKLDCRRARAAAAIDFDNSTVGGSVSLRSGSPRTQVSFDNSSVQGAAKLFMRNFGKQSQNRDTSFEFVMSRFASLRVGAVLRTRTNVADLTSTGNTITGDVLIKGDFEIDSQDDTVGGNLVVKKSHSAREVAYQGAMVTGDMEVRAGNRGDRIILTACNLGRLDVRGGAGNDLVFTGDCTLGAGSRYNGSKGNQDRLVTSSDGTDLPTTSVEVVETNTDAVPQ